MNTFPRSTRRAYSTALVAVLFACTSLNDGPAAPPLEMPAVQLSLNLGFGPDPLRRP